MSWSLGWINCMSLHIPTLLWFQRLDHGKYFGWSRSAWLWCKVQNRVIFSHAKFVHKLRLVKATWNGPDGVLMARLFPFLSCWACSIHFTFLGPSLQVTFCDPSAEDRLMHNSSRIFSFLHLFLFLSLVFFFLGFSGCILIATSSCSRLLG